MSNHVVRFVALFGLALLASGGCKKATSKNADDPKPADVRDSSSKPTPPPQGKAPPKAAMTITVPVTPSHQACHDTLAQSAAKLLERFKTEVVALANDTGTPWDRLDKVLAKSDELWADYLNGGGNPRVTQSSWDCTVADLAEGLVNASIAELASASADEKKTRLDALEKIVEGRFANAPNNMSMSFAISGARPK